ncbi:hypothetical protein [Mycobacteroides abscessus]|uniref:hypothetical protein n=2 Tax=Mycobacteroides abscessus TaxID=36809 RepID=UPI00026837AE|nr:hypothetical protein [Mycobacteroides abscessus]EIT89474.1 hypothetical protein MA4S0303_3272 [Mycobacteroides abscessus 4S-0303]EIT91467.1 hypothetical protein MA4S0726RB_2796 [Mycobacteroides abscessus 4S-0726-RB]EIT95016.1 hypothetical protein MA4S0726RA_3206 [Mycobacteroides abscessus 4S-0726-RA]EIV59449.1 hypothetical protein MA4S0116S_2344 [Mycobacteroides abscessus 4S-0116-S]RIR35600.1 hypothetical protein D2E38_11990 [Mycobacteroides abscessus]
MSSPPTLTDAQKLMAEVIGVHDRKPWGQHDGWWECCCGEVHSYEHIAVEIDKALGGLTAEKSWRVGRLRGLVLDSPNTDDAEVIASRWAGSWTRVPHA